jgi:hypothetical protein
MKGTDTMHDSEKIEMSCDAEDSLCTGTESKMPAPEQLRSNRRRRTRLEAALLEHNLRVTHHRKTARTSPDTPKDRTSSGRKATPPPSKHPLKLKFPGVIKQEDWYTMQEAHGCKAEVDTPPDRKHQVAKKAKKSVSKDEKDLRLSQGMYDMIEACLATKKIWMRLKTYSSLDGSGQDRKSNTIKKFASMFHPYGENWTGAKPVSAD